MNKYDTKQFLSCNACDCNILTPTKTIMRRSDDLECGEKFTMQRINKIHTTIPYDIEIHYKCFSCAKVNILTNDNRKGGVVQVWRLK